MSEPSDLRIVLVEMLAAILIAPLAMAIAALVAFAIVLIPDWPRRGELKAVQPDMVAAPLAKPSEKRTKVRMGDR